MTTLDQLISLRNTLTNGLDLKSAYASSQAVWELINILMEREQAIVKECVTTQPPVDSVGEKIEWLLADGWCVELKANYTSPYCFTVLFHKELTGMVGSVQGKTLDEALDAALAKVASQ